MTDRLLHVVLTLVPSICTISLLIIVTTVIRPRRREHRPIRVPLTIGLVLGGIGLCVSVVNLVVAFTS